MDISTARPVQILSAIEATQISKQPEGDRDSRYPGNARNCPSKGQPQPGEEWHLLAWAGEELPTRPELLPTDHQLEPQLEEGPISNLGLEEETDKWPVLDAWTRGTLEREPDGGAQDGGHQAKEPGQAKGPMQGQLSEMKWNEIFILWHKENKHTYLHYMK